MEVIVFFVVVRYTQIFPFGKRLEIFIILRVRFLQGIDTDHTFKTVSTGTISLQSPTRSCNPTETISSGLMKAAVSN